MFEPRGTKWGIEKVSEHGIPRLVPFMQYVKISTFIELRWAGLKTRVNEMGMLSKFWLENLGIKDH